MITFNRDITAFGGTHFMDEGTSKTLNWLVMHYALVMDQPVGSRLVELSKPCS